MYQEIPDTYWLKVTLSLNKAIKFFLKKPFLIGTENDLFYVEELSLSVTSFMTPFIIYLLSTDTEGINTLLLMVKKVTL